MQRTQVLRKLSHNITPQVLYEAIVTALPDLKDQIQAVKRDEYDYRRYYVIYKTLMAKRAAVSKGFVIQNTNIPPMCGDAEGYIPFPPPYMDKQDLERILKPYGELISGSFRSIEKHNDVQTGGFDFVIKLKENKLLPRYVKIYDEIITIINKDSRIQCSHCRQYGHIMRHCKKRQNGEKRILETNIPTISNYKKRKKKKSRKKKCSKKNSDLHKKDELRQNRDSLTGLRPSVDRPVNVAVGKILKPTPPPSHSEDKTNDEEIEKEEGRSLEHEKTGLRLERDSLVGLGPNLDRPVTVEVRKITPLLPAEDENSDAVIETEEDRFLASLTEYEREIYLKLLTMNSDTNYDDAKLLVDAVKKKKKELQDFEKLKRFPITDVLLDDQIKEIEKEIKIHCSGHEMERLKMLKDFSYLKPTMCYYPFDDEKDVDIRIHWLNRYVVEFKIATKSNSASSAACKIIQQWTSQYPNIRAWKEESLIRLTIGDKKDGNMMMDAVKILLRARKLVTEI